MMFSNWGVCNMHMETNPDFWTKHEESQIWKAILELKLKGSKIGRKGLQP
jgi:hypothetical protein